VDSLIPVDARWLPRQELDGGTVLSDEYALPGPVRALCWVIIDDRNHPDVLHLLFDTADAHAALYAAHAVVDVYVPNRTVGTIAATCGDITDAVVTTYRRRTP
jgi:hypothetical protein